MGHPGRSHQVIQGQLRVGLHIRVMPGGAGELPSGGFLPPLGVYLRHPLHHFKQPCPPGNAIRFEGGRDRQTDGFIGPALVRHHQIGGQRVQAALNALHGSVKAAKINGKINALFHIRHPPTIVPQVISIIHAVKVIVHMFDDNGKK